LKILEVNSIKKIGKILLLSLPVIFIFKYYVLNQVIFKKENIQIANFYGNNENFVSAIDSKNSKLVANFLDEGRFDVNYKDIQHHRNLLFWSLLRKNYFLTNKLIELGADVNIVDTWNITPLHIAASDQNREIVQLLIKKGHKVSPQESKLGLTPLDIAIIRNNKDIVQILKENGAKKSSELH
jgi:ankyrin repeat protein